MYIWWKERQLRILHGRLISILCHCGGSRSPVVMTPFWNELISCVYKRTKWYLDFSLHVVVYSNSDVEFINYEYCTNRLFVNLLLSITSGSVHYILEVQDIEYYVKSLLTIKFIFLFFKERKTRFSPVFSPVPSRLKNAFT